MMNEKQIYNRMNKCYEEVFRDEPTDEWYGDDNPKVWRFNRPGENIGYKMVMNEEEKRIDIYYRYNDKGEYLYKGTYSWKK